MPYFLPPAVSVPLKPNPKAEAVPPNKHQPARKPTRYRRTPSWSGWVRSLLPSHRPERGGTLRRRGFWESEESRQPNILRRHVTESSQSRTSRTHGPDHIVRWNTAKDLPETRSEAAQAHSRAAPADVRMSRIWSRALAEETELCQPHEARRADARPNKEIVASTSESYAISVIERRLAQTRQAIEARKEARRQRRDLKESGDYLGVQGINPATGQLDMITPNGSEENVASFAWAAPESQSSENECSALLMSVARPPAGGDTEVAESQIDRGQETGRKEKAAASAADMDKKASPKAKGESKTEKQPMESMGPTAKEECNANKQYAENQSAGEESPRKTEGGVRPPSPGMRIPGAYPAQLDIEYGRRHGLEDVRTGKAYANTTSDEEPWERAKEANGAGDVAPVSILRGDQTRVGPAIRVAGEGRQARDDAGGRACAGAGDGRDNPRGNRLCLGLGACGFPEGALRG